MTSFRATRVERPPLPFFLSWPGMVVAVFAVLSYEFSEGNFSALVSPDALAAMGDFIGGFWPPAHDSEFLQFLVRPVIETVAIAVLGVVGAVTIAFPLAVLSASPELLATQQGKVSALRRAGYVVARLTLNVMRSVPELIWALLFVRAVGVGPLAGVLAIAIGYAGVFGKVFSEIFESVPRAPIQSLISYGATATRAFVFALLPTAAPLMASYTLYRFDCALRASAILGIVGAGGLGQQLELSIRMFDHHQVATIVIIMFVLVATVDQVSQWTRRRLQEAKELLPHGHAGLIAWGASFTGLLLLMVGCAMVLDISPFTLFTTEAREGMAALATSMFPPALDGEFLAKVAPALGETIAISVLGTLLAVAMALVLAYPAAYRVFVLESRVGADGAPEHRPSLRIALHRVSRAILNLGRTLPEILWAFIFIFAVGLGPFAGALALAVHTAGVLGRLYAEVLEETNLGAYNAARSAGAPGGSAILFSLLPAALPQLVAYTLYRWEVNIRASTVMGVVGAGGIGMLLHMSLSLFQHHEVLTLILAILGAVTVVDLVSNALRHRVINGNVAVRRSIGHGQPVEVVVDRTRYLVVDMSATGARAFVRPGSNTVAPGAVLPIVLDFGAEARLNVRARVVWRRDEPAGTYIGLAFMSLGLLKSWVLRRAVARHGNVNTIAALARFEAW